MGRKAKVWKGHEELINIGTAAGAGTLSLKEQLNVKISLRYMRKAHTTDRRREDDRLGSCSDNRLSGVGDLSTYGIVQEVTVKIRTLEDIMAEAKHNFNISKDRRKLEREYSKGKVLRPIFPALLEEIRKQEEGPPTFNRPQSAANTAGERRTTRGGLDAMLGSAEEPLLPSQIIAAEKAQERGEMEDVGLGCDRYRQLSQATLLMSLDPCRGSRRAELVPQSIKRQLLNKEESAGADKDSGKSGGGSGGKLAWSESRTQRNLRTAIESGQLEEGGVFGIEEDDGFPSQVHVSRPQGLEEEEEDDLDPVAARVSIVNTGSFSGHYMRDSFRGGDRATENSSSFGRSSNSNRSSCFSSSVVQSDERIMKAQQQRDDVSMKKDQQVVHRIRQKELRIMSKAEKVRLAQRQRAWIIGVVVNCRMKVLQDALEAHRELRANWKGVNATSRAIDTIEKWWRMARIRFIYRRKPHFRLRILGVLMPFLVRRRLRKKNLAAAMLLSFLQDCTGISESMRCIYAYRQNIIRLQRYVKSWVVVQMHRMRVLWLQCEKVYKFRAREERRLKVKEEKTSLQAMSQMRVFSGTVEEINTVRRELNKLLDEQEEARFLKQAALARKVEMRRMQLLSAQTKSMLFGATSAFGEAAAPVPAPGRNGRNWRRLSVDYDTPSLPGLPAATASPTSHVQDRPKGHKGKVRHAPVPWHTKIRSSAANVKTFDLLRAVLTSERRRHILSLLKHDKKEVGDCRVDHNLLRNFLKDPSGYRGLEAIADKIVEQRVPLKASGASAKYREPFLLLTKGASDSLEQLVQENRNIRF